jgi:hypothetical protein
MDECTCFEVEKEKSDLLGEIAVRRERKLRAERVND